MPCQRWLTTQTWSNAAKVSLHLRSSIRFDSCRLLICSIEHNELHFTVVQTEMPWLNKYIGYKEWWSTRKNNSTSLHPSSYSSSLLFFYFYTPPSSIPLIPFLPLLYHFSISTQPFYNSQTITWTSVGRTELVLDGTYGCSQFYQHGQPLKQLQPPTSWPCGAATLSMGIWCWWPHWKQLVNHRSYEWPGVCHAAFHLTASRVRRIKCVIHEWYRPEGVVC